MENTLENMAGRKKTLNLRAIFPYLAFILVFLFFSCTAFDRFVTYSNMTFILQQTAIMAIVATGMLFVVVQGSIDLSVGSILGISGMVAADLAQKNIFLGLAAGVLVGAIVGLCNGLIHTYLKIPSMIATLGMQKAVRGITILYSHSNSIMMEKSLKVIGKYPTILFIMFGVLLIAYIVYNYTVFGRYCVACGGDERVARLNGIPATMISILVFIVSGILSGLAGVILAARLGAGVPTNGTGQEMEVVAAIALGGASLSGGSGSIVNTFVGALIISMLSNGLVILGVPSEAQDICTGVVLILAVFISLDRSKVGIIK